MKKIFFIVLIVLPIITIRLQAQTNYYWSNGEKQGLNIINTKKFVLVDSTITDSSSLVTALNDTSLTVNDFTTFFLPSHFPLDSVDVYKTCAIIESNDSICVDSLLANTHIKYVSGYYSVNDAEVGTSHLFYVKLTHTQDTTLLDSLSNIQKTKVLGTFDSENKWFIVECTNDSNSDALTMSNTFYETGIFEYSHPSFIGNFKPDAIESRSVSCANDELFHEQWGLNNVTDNTNIDVSACEAWRCTKGDTNIIIAILDSGVKLDHPDLSTIDPYISYDIMSGSTPSQLYQNLSPKLYSHGTNAAGIIGAQHNSIGVAGIAPDCAIMSLSLDWDIPHEFGDPIAPIDICLYDGISYAWQNGADIISNSWSGATNEDIILDAINQATTYGRNEYGCIIVNSTGNGDLNEVLFPSNLSNVIGVGAIDSCGIRGIRPSIPGDEDNLTCGSHWPFGGSNYGFGLSVVAPGSDVTTTTIVNDQGISTEYKSGFNGTSAAAPYISGVAALILSINPDLTYEEVKDIIEQSAQKIREDFYSYNVNNPNGTWNYKLGYGMVNAYDALQLVCADMCNVTTYVSSLQNVTWSDEKNVCSNVIVDGTLTIDNKTNFLFENPQITVNNGGHLIIEDDAELYTWFDIPFDGNIVVNYGGTIEIKSGATLSLSDDGNISIMANSSPVGEMIFNQGAAIELLDENTVLNIAGDLTIANNATFTFTGDGYVKFSSPGDDATYNIFCGTGSSMSFSGSVINDKVLEVDQATLRLPNMSSISFSNCKIEMASGSPGRRILAEGTTDFSFNNVKVTSDNGVYNGHRGLYFYNQTISITNSQFEDGLTGIRAYTTNPLSISGTSFVDNSKGIYMLNSGIDLDGCSFVDNTDFGLYCTNMSLPSSIDNCMFVTNENGMYYHGSTSANIDIDDTYFNENENDGIQTSGGFNCNLECCYVTDNTQYGVYATNGTKINPYKCDMSGNYHTIELDYGSVDLNGKYNQLQALNDGYTVYGDSPARCVCGTPVTQNCHYNRWASSLSTGPIWNVNYKLYVSNCSFPPTYLYLSDPYKAYQTCGSKSTSLDPVDDIVTTDKTLSLLLDSENNEMKSGEINSSTDYENQLLNQMNQYQNLFHSDNSISYNTYASVYNRIQEIIAEYFMSIDLDSEDFEFNNAADLVIDFNNSLTISDENISEFDYYWYKLDVALINRMRKNYNLAAEEIEELLSYYSTSEIIDQSDIEFAENWLCVINAEKLFSEGLLSDDEFINAMENCQICEETRSLQDDKYGAGEEKSSLISNDSDIQLNISPNPNSGNFILTIHNIESDYEIKIINYLGQQVRNYQKNKETQTISVEGLNQGHYSVVIFVNGEVCKTEKIIVE